MKKSRAMQAWEPGKTVQVGFLKLKVVFHVPTPGDGRPDAVVLVTEDHARFYKFVPHWGIEHLTLAEARQLHDEAQALAQDQAQRLLAQTAGRREADLFLAQVQSHHV